MDAQRSLAGRTCLRVILIALVTVFAVFVAAAFGGNAVPAANAQQLPHVTNQMPPEFHVFKRIVSAKDEDGKDKLTEEELADAQSKAKGQSYPVNVELTFPEGTTESKIEEVLVNFKGGQVPAVEGNTVKIDGEVLGDGKSEFRISKLPVGTEVTITEGDKPQLDGFTYGTEKFIFNVDGVKKREQTASFTMNSKMACYVVLLENPVEKADTPEVPAPEKPGEFHIKKVVDYSKLTNEADKAEAEKQLGGKTFPVTIDFEFPEGTNREELLQGKNFELIGDTKAKVKLDLGTDVASYEAAGGDHRGIAFSDLPVGTKATLSEGGKPTLNGFKFEDEHFVVREGHPENPNKLKTGEGKTVTIVTKGDDCFEITLTNTVAPNDTPGIDTPGTDTPGTDTPGTDIPGTDTPGTDIPGTDTPGTDTRQNLGSASDSRKLGWLLLLVPAVAGLIWLFNQGQGTSSAPAPEKPGDKPQPGKPVHSGDTPQPGNPVDEPKLGQPGSPEQPVKQAAPGEGRQPIQSVPSGATEKSDDVADFIG